MHVVVPGRVVVPVAVASLHGLVDVDYVLRPDLYVAYVAAWLVPARLVSPLFFVASIRHFAIDVGALSSVLMHVTWGALFLCGRAHYCHVHCLDIRSQALDNDLCMRHLASAGLLLFTRHVLGPHVDRVRRRSCERTHVDVQGRETRAFEDVQARCRGTKRPTYQVGSTLFRSVRHRRRSPGQIALGPLSAARMRQGRESEGSGTRVLAP